MSRRPPSPPPPPSPAAAAARVAVAVALVATALAGAAVPTPVDARAPPTPVCGVCTDALADAAADRGIDLEAGRDELTVRIGPDGSVTWVARVDLRAGADALRDDAVRRRVVRDARGRVIEARPDSRVTGSTLVVTVRTEAPTAAGAVVFDGLVPAGAPSFATGGEGTRLLGADALVIRAPDGYTIRGREGDVRRWRGSGTALDRDLRVTVVRRDALLPGVRAAVARTVA